MYTWKWINIHVQSIQSKGNPIKMRMYPIQTTIMRAISNPVQSTTLSIQSSPVIQIQTSMSAASAGKLTLLSPAGELLLTVRR
jgi:hypothetical protein